MKCPHCGEEIADEEIAKHLGNKGGKKGKTVLTPERQAKMQAGRGKKKEEREKDYTRHGKQ